MKGRTLPHVLKYESKKCFLNHFTEWIVESKVWEIEEVCGLTEWFVLFSLHGCPTLPHCIQIHVYWLVTVNDWILWVWVWFIEVISMIHVCTSYVMENYWSIWSKQHSNSSCSSRWSSISSGVNRNISWHHNSIPTIPCLRLYPIDWIKQCIRRPITCIRRRYPFNIMISLEKRHQDCLNRLTLIKQCFCSNF